jgi:hypothetical protein
VRIWHQGDDVLVFSIKTKMHAIGAGVIDGLGKAIAEAEANYKGLVIWGADAAEGGAFSAGADLQAMLPLFMSGGVKAIEPEVAKLQACFQRMKYANVPVVAAVAGLALGGGCELALHTARRVASIESYIGLVEVGVGLIPAGGGLKEAAHCAPRPMPGATTCCSSSRPTSPMPPWPRYQSRRWRHGKWAISSRRRDRLQPLRAAARGEGRGTRDVRCRLPSAACRNWSPSPAATPSAPS